jgi:hypothetical protein
MIGERLAKASQFPESAAVARVGDREVEELQAAARFIDPNDGLARLAG